MPDRTRTPHGETTADFLKRLQAWAEPRADIRALMVVGSVARGDAQPDSDVDIILLTTDPARYLENLEWVSDFGVAQRAKLEHYGRVTSVRAAYADGLEIEFAVAPPDWASAPFDSGTAAVVRSGMLVLLDRDGEATALAGALAPSNQPLQPTRRTAPRG